MSPGTRCGEERRGGVAGRQRVWRLDRGSADDGIGLIVRPASSVTGACCAVETCAMRPPAAGVLPLWHRAADIHELGSPVQQQRAELGARRPMELGFGERPRRLCRQLSRDAPGRAAALLQRAPHRPRAGEPARPARPSTKSPSSACQLATSPQPSRPPTTSPRRRHPAADLGQPRGGLAVGGGALGVAGRVCRRHHAEHASRTRV